MLPADSEHKIQALISKLGYYPGTAWALVEGNGQCAYCGRDLLESRLGYASLSLDHLLPKEKYPDLVAHTANFVLACGICNSLKGRWDPLPTGAVPDLALTERRAELIRRVQEYLYDRQAKADRDWIRALAIMRGE